jgi:CRISPR-associated endonuclease/helicase Cas3
MDKYDKEKNAFSRIGMDSVFAAHISEDGRIQTIIEHLEGTAGKARDFAEGFGAGDNAYLCGLLHDIGKYSEAFQKRIYGGKHRVDHSTAGAYELNRRFGDWGRLLAYCVAGHHTGLPDFGSSADSEEDPTLTGNFRRELEPYQRFADDLSIPEPQQPVLRSGGSAGMALSMYARMLYSCLVDADFLDTEMFMQNSRRNPAYESIDALNRLMDTKISELNNKLAEVRSRPKPSQNDSLNMRRGEILQSCIDGAKSERGLFTLTVPTGGGKTLSSLAFALRHAQRNGMRRVIYVIPYNSIIEQNAQVFEEVLGSRNVLQHHSGIDYDDKDDVTTYKKLATENWDMPVVVTTAVQFFESLFANRSSRCRKLHNIANSVVIFDEAQLLPLPYLKPCVLAISELVLNYKCSAVLCSATQPALSRFFGRLEPTELYTQAREAFPLFKRAKLEFVGALDDDTLAGRLNAELQVLCIVSTRKQAQNVYAKLRGDGVFHLSTLMVPAHRREVLTEIRQRLKDELPCRVVSTSLVEAGVDVDFPVVYRAEAGLDSLIQAAGRCNREGRRPISSVYVFAPEAQYRLPDMLKRPAHVMRSVATQFDDAMSLDAIQAYFNELYDVEGEGADAKGIVKQLDQGCRSMSFPFAAIAGEFKLIDENTCPIVVPFDKDACALIAQLRTGKPTRELLRAIQPYTVNVYPNHYKALEDGSWLEVLDEELVVLADGKYSDKTGLDASSDTDRFLCV